MRRGARRPLRAPALRLALVAATLLPGSTLAAGPLALQVRGPWFEGGELVVEVRQSGALAGRPLAVQLAVDGVSVGRFPTNGTVTRLRAESERLTAGTHEILVKSGSERAAATIRVWPGWLPWAAGGLALAAGFLALVRRRRKLSHSAP